ncbi:MAG TPA: YkvA family protein [Anaerolineales bacterium]|nr:YkvA family protein [Anaerolineales bacterium]
MVSELTAVLNQLKARARALKREVFAIYTAARDPRTPWFAKALVFLTVAYTLSPIDLIPDFIPILGYLDDLLIVPGGIWLAMRLIPPEVLEEARATAATRAVDQSIGKIGAALIILLWIIAVLGGVYLFLRFTKRI